MHIKLWTPRFRVSFPNVFEPRAAVEGQKPKYSLTMLFNMAEIDKNPEQKKLWDLMIEAAKTTAANKWPKALPANLQSPFRKGEEKEQYSGYGPGIIFVTASSKLKPKVVDQQVVKIIDPEDFYAGCYAHATVNPYAWSYLGKNGVSFGLQNIQKLADGDAFGGRSDAENDFDAQLDTNINGTSSSSAADALFR